MRGKLIQKSKEQEEKNSNEAMTNIDGTDTNFVSATIEELSDDFSDNQEEEEQECEYCGHNINSEPHLRHHKGLIRRNIENHLNS